MTLCRISLTKRDLPLGNDGPNGTACTPALIIRATIRWYERSGFDGGIHIVILAKAGISSQDDCIEILYIPAFAEMTTRPPTCNPYALEHLPAFLSPLLPLRNYLIRR